MYIKKGIVVEINNSPNVVMLDSSRIKWYNTYFDNKGNEIGKNEYNKLHK